LPLDEYRSFNALAETINGLYKTEVIEHEGPWSGKKDGEMAPLNRVHSYNKKRLFGPLGYISPATAEKNFYTTELRG
jgi:putative transposase